MSKPEKTSKATMNKAKKTSRTSTNASEKQKSAEIVLSKKSSEREQGHHPVPSHWKQVTFTDENKQVIVPNPDIAFPTLQVWLKLRSKLILNSDTGRDFANAFYKSASKKVPSETERELLGEITSTLAARMVRPLPPIGAGWHDVAMLALEAVTYAIMNWRYARVNKKSLLRSTANFMIWSAECENERTTKISMSPLVIAQVEGEQIIWMPLWAFDAHTLLPPLKQEWTRRCIPLAMKCANQFIGDILLAVMGGDEAKFKLAPNCVVQEARKALDPRKHSSLLQTSRGEIGNISPGRFVNLASGYVRDQLDKIPALPPERFPASKTIF